MITSTHHKVFNESEEKYIEHEIRMRIVESRNGEFIETFRRLEGKIDSHFKWMIGTMIGIILATLGTTVSIVCVLISK